MSGKALKNAQAQNGKAASRSLWKQQKKNQHNPEALLYIIFTRAGSKLNYIFLGGEHAKKLPKNLFLFTMKVSFEYVSGW